MQRKVVVEGIIFKIFIIALLIRVMQAVHAQDFLIQVHYIFHPIHIIQLVC